MKTVLRVFSLAFSIVGVFWGVFALTTSLRSGDNPFLAIPEAAGFLFLGAAGWAVFGALAQILERLERLEQIAARNP